MLIISFTCGEREHLETVASSIYEALRSFNKQSVDMIYSEMFPNEGSRKCHHEPIIKSSRTTSDQVTLQLLGFFHDR